MLKSSETKPHKIVTASYASAADPTSDNCMVAYERNVAVLLQLYIIIHESKSNNNHMIMLKLLKMTHQIRRININSSN